MNCHDGYYLHEDTLSGQSYCFEKSCDCDHGTGAKGTACPSHNDQNNPKCASCYSGYVLFQDKCVKFNDLIVNRGVGDPEFYVECDGTEAADCGSEPCIRKLTGVVSGDGTDSVQAGDVICTGGGGGQMSNLELLQSLQSCS